MSLFFLLLALLLLAFWLWIFVHSMQETPLPFLPLISEENRAGCSIVVAMRNEAQRSLSESIPSILAQLGEGDELIIVDDHSADDSFAIVSRLIASDPRARIIRSAEERNGKREALAQGALASTRPYILFIDADVVVAEDAARRSVAFCEGEKIDCLSIFPQTIAISFWERVALVATSWVLYAGDWFRQTNSDAHPVGLGVAGVFILVRRETYLAIGGFESIDTNVLEDVAFANRVREQGHRYRYLRADGLVKHRMYRSLREIIDGMSKNTFPGLGGSLGVAMVTALGFSLVLLGPVALLIGALFLPHMGLITTLLSICSGLTIPMMFRAQCKASRLMGTAPGLAAIIASPLGVPIWLWILARSIYMNRIRRSVLWRGHWINPQSESTRRAR